MSKMTRVLFLAAALVAVAGCGDGQPATGTVTGDVTWDGKPLPDGHIKFETADGKSAGEAPIKDGKYTATVQTGDAVVRITSNKVIGKKKMYEGAADSPTVDVTEELLPPKYNVQSELKMTVAKGDQQKPFDLKK